MPDILFITTTDRNELRSQANGTLLIATKLLQADFDVDILRFYQIENYNKSYNNFIDDITNKIISMNPRGVSFYTLWPYYHIMLRIAQRIKKRNSEIITILGGPQSSATAYETMKTMNFIDYISTGEGENVVVPFFDSILNNDRKDIQDIPGLYYRNNSEIEFNHAEVSLCDLNSLPYWDKKLYTVVENGDKLSGDTYFMPIDAGRGCPYSCTFCCTSLFWKRTYRLKSPKKIVDDIKYYYNNFGIKSFWFSHDAFTTNKQLVSNVCDYIIENNLDIKWKCTARVDCISEELILKMKKAGLTQIELGVETGSPRMQKVINKNLNLDKTKKMIDFIIKNEIHVGLFFMYGFPEETEDDLNQTLELLFDVLDMGVRHTSMSFCRFNPATDITNRYIDKLELNSKIKTLTRDIFGYSEELEMIKENKKIFSPFFHLNTSVRNEYQYIEYLNYIYNQFPNSIKYIRKLYNGDNLKFYKDFYNNNIQIFDLNMSEIKKNVIENPTEMLKNTIKNFNLPYINQLLALVEYDFNVQKVSKSKKDISIREKYNFSYIEYQMKLPIEQFTNHSTEILLEKKDGKFNSKILAII